MNKDKINSKIEDLEAELQKLKQLANEPKQRTPELGDVWEDKEGYGELIATGGKGVDLISGHISLKKYNQYQTHSSDTYLGKHKDVYVKISDVRAALSHKDYGGDSVLNGRAGVRVAGCGLDPTRKALRKLNIITD